MVGKRRRKWHGETITYTETLQLTYCIYSFLYDGFLSGGKRMALSDR